MTKFVIADEEKTVDLFAIRTKCIAVTELQPGDKIVDGDRLFGVTEVTDLRPRLFVRTDFDTRQYSPSARVFIEA